METSAKDKLGNYQIVHWFILDSFKHFLDSFSSIKANNSLKRIYFSIKASIQIH